MKIICLFLLTSILSCHNKNGSDIVITDTKSNDNVAIIQIDNTWSMTRRMPSSLPPPPPPPPPLPQKLPKDVFINPENHAYFKGCEGITDKDERKKCSDKNIITYIRKNLIAPDPRIGSCIGGTVVIRFIVEKDGTLSFNDDINKIILRDPGCGHGHQALKMIKSMPKWNPATINGKPVKMQYTIPVRFENLETMVDYAAMPNDSFIYKFVEYMPHFPGCEDIEEKDYRKKCSNEKIVSHINKNMKYPAMAKKHGIEGTIVIRFIIEKDGSISFNEDKEKVILRGGDILGEEAIRVIQLMPKWIPGKQDGKAVRVEFILPMKINWAE